MPHGTQSSSDCGCRRVTVEITSLPAAGNSSHPRRRFASRRREPWSGPVHPPAAPAGAHQDGVGPLRGCLRGAPRYDAAGFPASSHLSCAGPATVVLREGDDETGAAPNAVGTVASDHCSGRARPPWWQRWEPARHRHRPGDGRPSRPGVSRRRPVSRSGARTRRKRREPGNRFPPLSSPQRLRSSARVVSRSAVRGRL